MKKKYIVILLFILSYSTYAQYAVRFEASDWKSVVAKAKQEKKLIFLDCYAVWCGPCKMLDRNVFTNPQFGQYVNDKYINYKLDMEKGEGIALQKKFKVSVYPTLLLIDPEREEIRHRVEGYNEPPMLIAKIEDGLGENNIEKLKIKYQQGTRDTAFIALYCQKLKDLGMEQELNECMADYFQQITDDNFVSPFHWVLISQYCNYWQTAEFQRFIRKNREFLSIAGQQNIDNKMLTVLFNTARYYALYNPQNYGGAPFNKPFYESFIAEIKHLQNPFISSVLVYMTAYNNIRENKFNALVEDGNAVLKYAITNPYLYHSPAEIHQWSLVLLSTQKEEFYPTVRLWLQQIIPIEQNQEYRKIYLQTLLQVALLLKDTTLKQETEKILSSL